MSMSQQDESPEATSPWKLGWPRLVGVVLFVLIIAVAVILTATAPPKSDPLQKDGGDPGSDYSSSAPMKTSLPERVPPPGVYPVRWGDAPLKKFGDVSETEVLDYLNDRMIRGDDKDRDFVATDEEILNTTESFCWAYENGETWEQAMDHFGNLAENADVDRSGQNVRTNLQIMSYTGTQFYCPTYKDEITKQIMEFQNPAS